MAEPPIPPSAPSADAPMDHRGKRRSARPQHSRRAILAGASNLGPSVAWQRNPELRDCHLSKHIYARLRTQGADLRVCAPGRTRTCTLRIRSKTPAVQRVLPGHIGAGGVGSTVRLITSRPTLSQRPDCHRDCQPHDPATANVRSNHRTPHRSRPILWGAVPRARSIADNSNSAATGSIR